MYAKVYKPMSNRNNITCGCKTGINEMLLQSDLNKWRLSPSYKLDKLYIYSESTIFLQIYEINFVEYNNQIVPNN